MEILVAYDTKNGSTAVAREIASRLGEAGHDVRDWDAIRAWADKVSRLLAGGA